MFHISYDATKEEVERKGTTLYKVISFRCFENNIDKSVAGKACVYFLYTTIQAIIIIITTEWKKEDFACENGEVTLRARNTCNTNDRKKKKKKKIRIQRASSISADTLFFLLVLLAATDFPSSSSSVLHRCGIRDGDGIIGDNHDNRTK